MPIPTDLRGQKYISLATFRKSGAAVRTPVWFAEGNDRLYLFTNPKSGKVKRIRNNPQVRLAPCTMRGRITGPEFTGTAHIIASADADSARALLKKKYWLMRVPFLWSKDSIFIELTLNQG
jgi:PPOX class probable F420-dependent enzyme